MTDLQPSLFDKTIEQRFAEFDRRHPEVMLEFVRLTRQALETPGVDRVGAKAVWERLRWSVRFDGLPDVDETVRLNNVFTAHYARAAMERYPDLGGCFETRKLRAA